MLTLKVCVRESLQESCRALGSGDETGEGNQDLGEGSKHAAEVIAKSPDGRAKACHGMASADLRHPKGRYQRART